MNDSSSLLLRTAGLNVPCSVCNPWQAQATLHGICNCQFRACENSGFSLLPLAGQFKNVIWTPSQHTQCVVKIRQSQGTALAYIFTLSTIAWSAASERNTFPMNKSQKLHHSGRRLERNTGVEFSALHTTVKPSVIREVLNCKQTRYTPRVCIF